jgi:hypothetical protein
LAMKWGVSFLESKVVRCAANRSLAAPASRDSRSSDRVHARPQYQLERPESAQVVDGNQTRGSGRSLVQGFWIVQTLRRGQTSEDVSSAGSACCRVPGLSCVEIFFRPFGACCISRFFPRLAPWAAFFRRFAAGASQNPPALNMTAQCDRDRCNACDCEVGGVRGSSTLALLAGRRNASAPT